MPLRGAIAAATACLACAPALALNPDCFTEAGCELATGAMMPGYADAGFHADGDNWIWTLRLESDDPDARLYFGGPNQFASAIFNRTEAGYSWTVSTDPFPYESRLSIEPLWTRLTFRSPRPFFDCDTPGPAGSVCGAEYRAFANSSRFFVLADVPTVRLRIDVQSFASVPEPADWALLIAGLVLCGANIRGRARGSAGGSIARR